MKDWFFYQEKGRTMGPLTAEDMRQRIQEGRLRLFDLVFREGEPTWKMAMEFHEFRDEFKKSTPVAKDRQWIVLQKKAGSEGEFVTTGPFSRDEVKEAILAGKISYSDYVWRPGFKEWKRIAKLEEFNDKLKKKADPPPLPPIPSESPEEMLKTVVEMKRPDFLKDTREHIPEDAGTPDLLRHPEIEHMPAARTERRTVTRIEGERPWPQRKRRHKTKPHTLWVDWAIVGLLTMSLGVGAFYVSRSMRRPKLSEFPTSTIAVEIQAPLPAGDDSKETSSSPPREVEPVVQFKPPGENTPAEVDPAPLPVDEVKSAVAPKEKIPSKEPSALVVAVHPQGLSQPRIEIRTDGSPDFPVMVQVVGMPGQVADGPGFYRFIRVRPSGDTAKPIELSSLKLPPGRFTLTAETGALRKEVALNYGTGDTSYKQNVARIRKMYAYAIWKERLDLIRLSQRLEEQLIDAVKKKKFTGKGLESVAAVKRGNSANFILFDEWWELKELYDSARRAPTDEPLDRLRKLRERLSTFSVWKFK